MNLPAHISRKDVARLLGCGFSARWIQVHEHRLGLDKARVRYIRCPVHYRTRQALLILSNQGFDIVNAKSLEATE